MITQKSFNTNNESWFVLLFISVSVLNLALAFELKLFFSSCLFV